MSFASRALVFLASVSLPLGMARADEGMWTFDAFPAAKMRADYGWAPDQAWLDKMCARFDQVESNPTAEGSEPARREAA